MQQKARSDKRDQVPLLVVLLVALVCFEVKNMLPGCASTFLYARSN